MPEDTSTQDAERAFVERYAERVRRYAERHLRDRDLAADLVQEVLVAVLTALREGRIEQPERLGSFVLTTCRHMVWDENRAASRRQRVSAAAGAGAEASVEPAVPAVEEVEVRRIERCVRRLGSREQSVVVLTYCEDWAADRIADVLGTTAGNVRVIRHRALAQLAACLRAPEAEP